MIINLRILINSSFDFNFSFILAGTPVVCTRPKTASSVASRKSQFSAITAITTTTSITNNKKAVKFAATDSTVAILRPETVVTINKSLPTKFSDLKLTIARSDGATVARQSKAVKKGNQPDTPSVNQLRRPKTAANRFG